MRLPFFVTYIRLSQNFINWGIKIRTWLTIGLGLFAGTFVFSDLNAVLGQNGIPSSQEQITLSFSPLVRTAAPAVVNIYTKKIVRARQAVPLFDDPFFRRFFGNQFEMELGYRKIYPA